MTGCTNEVSVYSEVVGKHCACACSHKVRTDGKKEWGRMGQPGRSGRSRRVQMEEEEQANLQVAWEKQS